MKQCPVCKTENIVCERNDRCPREPTMLVYINAHDDRQHWHMCGPCAEEVC